MITQHTIISHNVILGGKFAALDYVIIINVAVILTVMCATMDGASGTSADTTFIGVVQAIVDNIRGAVRNS
jgi:hypothetical protein